MLQWQLDRIGQESRKSNFTMAERYDMDHVYYKDGTDFHGRQGYYEYPAAFSWVCGNVFFAPIYTENRTFAKTAQARDKTQEKVEKDVPAAGASP
jgi:hypothetical protein